MTERATERKDRYAHYKRVFSKLLDRSDIPQRVIAEGLGVVRSYVESLKSIDGAKHLRVADLESLPESIRMGIIQEVLDRSGNRYVLVQASDDVLCPSKAETLHRVVVDVGSVAKEITGSMLDGRQTRDEVLAIRQECRRGRTTLAAVEAGCDGWLARDAAESRPVIGLAKTRPSEAPLVVKSAV